MLKSFSQSIRIGSISILCLKRLSSQVMKRLTSQPFFSCLELSFCIAISGVARSKCIRAEILHFSSLYLKAVLPELCAAAHQCALKATEVFHVSFML